jgi:hypothetical protein
MLAGVVFAGQKTDSTALKQFDDNVRAYSELHRRIAKDVPKLEDVSDPALIEANQKRFTEALQSARAGAKHGDICASSVAPVLISIVRSQLAGPENAPAKSTVLEEGNPKAEPTANVQLHVNAEYPSAAPLSTVPPSLLLKLPKLPDELDYRFVGKHLILRDTRANLIVDYVLNAAP